MGVGTAVGGISAAAGLGGAALQGNAAQNAAGVQAQAANEAAQLQYQQAQQALGFEEQQYQNTLGLEEPQYLSGIGGLSTLDQLMGLPAVTPDTNIFSNPLGSLQQPGASPVSSFGGMPGIGQIPLDQVPGLGGGNFMPMQAESAMRQVPLSNLAQMPQGGPMQTGNPAPAIGNGNAGLTPEQQAAQIEGFSNSSNVAGNPVNLANGALDFNPPGGDFTSPNPRFTGLNQPGGIQGGPVFDQTQGPITLGNQTGNTPAGSSLGGQSVPLSSLSGVTGTNPIAGGNNPNVPIQRGPILDPIQHGPETINNGTVGNTGLPAGFLSQTWNTPFVAPTAEQAAQMPGYQFQLQQGQQALENSAAARGGLLSGGTAKALDQYSQGVASTDYQNLYNQALTQYQQAYNIFNQNQANVFNRYAALAGIGQTSAQQLSNAGLATGSNVGNTLLTSGAQIGGDIQNAAAATASGYVGSANAYGGALSSLGGLASMIPLYNMLGNQNPNLITLNTGGSSVIPGLATDPTAFPGGDVFSA